MAERNGLDIALKAEGLDELKKSLRGLSSDDRAKVNKEVVDQWIVPAAKKEVPARSGKLKATIHADSTATYGFILAGARGDVAYAGVIHFGWSTRGMGTGRSVAELRAAAGRAGSLNALSDSALRKAARLGKVRERKIIEREKTGRFVKGGKVIGMSRKLAVRGGPIKPNPFIYEAIDARSDEVFRAYEDQLMERAKIEGLL